MPLFQKAVLNKYLKSLDQNTITEKFKLFTQHFSNPIIQENIRNSKEEQYQEGFLNDLFVNVLGYTKNPTPNYNLTTELKNIKDSKKVDGAILINGITKGVIELKGMNTTDLSTIENQAFGYKNNHPDCTYIITSNFQKIRFYIDNAIEHIEFDLFNISLEEFQTLYLCLAYENIESDIPKRIKNESLTQEDNITKKLYKDYSDFKKNLYQNLVLLNPDIDQLVLFKKAQKLLDRFLFLFFAEDRGLLQPNSVRTIINRWETLKELDVYEPLIDSYRKYFTYLNKGYQSKDLIVFAYNGGLFAPDEILDNVKIDDELLKLHTIEISNYDFASEIDVNILGHIFENSLNEIEEVQSEIKGEIVDKAKTKRKKDGVFYTPKYITKYIVDNTVGKLCREKKIEIDIKEEEYHTEKKIQTKTKKVLLDKLDNYRSWLLQLTICDPACGSGAFLNQALDFLINEHRYIDELQAKLFGDAMVLTDVEGSILENNLYGVDINEESIEIAKLSLWLRTAEPNRKLTSLTNNLKCGNSLIDDPEIAGDLAFNWEKEFPQVFAKGGFDVVIGNPPYVNIEKLDTSTKEFIYNNYQSAVGRTDLYVLFIDKSLQLLKKDGVNGFIIPYAFTNQNYAELLRKKIVNDNTILSIIDTSKFFVFDDAVVKTIILLLTIDKKKRKTIIFNPQDHNNLEINFHELLQEDFLKLNKCVFETKPFTEKLGLKEKLEHNTLLLSELCLVAYGVRVNNKYDKSKPKSYYVYDSYKEGLKKFVEGKHINRYFHYQTGWLDYQISEHYNSMFPELFENEKLIFINVVSDRIRFSYDNENYYNSHTVINCVKIDKLKDVKHISARKIVEEKNLDVISKTNLKYILSIVNSTLMNWYFLSFLSEGLHFYPDDAKKLPIKNISLLEQQSFIEKSNLMLSLNKDLQDVSNKFIKLLQSELGITELSKKLQDWYNLSFTDFGKELKKKKIELSLSQKSEWMEFFEEQKQKTEDIQTQINQTDKQIDKMVYELYELTDEEIEIVENS